ncbi:nucleotidyltransferase domain-containing protein [Candidatus Uhrbacteria bacterium]|nr:nucleotidyltransferase domain-containing protein [Candidatus Uhrbacteria bacterium]
MLQKNRKKIEKITKKIIAQYKPEKIVLFGSYAWGAPQIDSDVDLLVIKNTNASLLDRERELRTILWGSGSPTDLLIYTPSELKRSMTIKNNLFIKDIVARGLTLYAKNPVR